MFVFFIPLLFLLARLVKVLIIDEFINNAFSENEFFSNLDEYGLDMNQITTELHPEVSEEIKKTQRENSLKLVENISETIVKKIFLK